jgi:GNAT superfamily N-acetyltransferase
MDNNRELTGAEWEQEADEITFISESYTSSESSEYNRSEDSSDDEFASSRRHKTTLIESEFLPADGTNRTLKIEISVSPGTWRDNITAKCTHEGKAIGHVIARLIHRRMITKHFWDIMDEYSRDTGMVAWTVFNRYGILRDKFKSHPVHRGTGAWGSELDDGPILLIEEVYITDVEWRRKGVGRAMVQQLLGVGEKCVNGAKPTDMSPGFKAFGLGSAAQFQKLSTVHALVMPGWLTKDVEPQYVGKSKRQKNEINLRAGNTAVSFYRSLGFRRIGSSLCFAYSFDPNHRAHSIASDMDFDPQMEPLDDQEDEPGIGDYIIPYGVEIQLGERTLSEMKREFPLHHAATALPDLECLEYLKKATAEDETNLIMVDRTHRTLLHILARKLKPESMRWLLAHVDVARSWKAARDINGDSPLDVLKDFLEDVRTKRHLLMGNMHVSDDFRGYSAPAVECLSLLDETPNGEDTHLYTSRLRYGCTCGQCIGGFLSPRMKLALLDQAGTLHDILSDSIDDGRSWVADNRFSLRYFAYDVRRKFKTHKSIRQGYANMYSCVRDCLESNLAPSVENMLQAVSKRSEWSPVTRKYLTRASDLPGIRAALTCIFNEAQDTDDRTGNGEFQTMYASEYSSLRVCRNDREFIFVARACGIDLELE